jgi:hypothetical protein
MAAVGAVLLVIAVLPIGGVGDGSASVSGVTPVTTTYCGVWSGASGSHATSSANVRKTKDRIRRFIGIMGENYMPREASAQPAPVSHQALIGEPI